MTHDINSRLRERSKMIKKYYKYGKMKSHLDELQEKTDECMALILDATEKYVRCIRNKLNAPLAAPETYLSILNHFLNNRKIPEIPPLILLQTFPKKLTFLTSFLQMNVHH